MELDDLEKKIIYHLMMQSDPMTVARLADLCNVSSNSIRCRLPDLNRKIKSENLQIHMKRSVGCTLEKIHEEENSSERLNDLQFTINRSQFASQSPRCDFIIRRLLCSSSYVEISKLCSMLFYSYSELHRDISTANQQLKKFNLRIVTRRNRGLCVEGSEFHKRLCLAFQHKRFIHYLTPEQQAQEPWFAAIFADIQKTATAQREFIDILKQFPDYAFSHLNFPKIWNMMYILKARHDKRDLLSFPEEDLETIRQLPSYELAKAALGSFQNRMHFESSEEEIISLAITMECYRSVRSFEDLGSNPTQAHLLAESERILQEIVDTLFASGDSVSEELVQVFACSLYTVVTLQHFHAPVDEETMFPLHNNETTSMDLALELHHILKRDYRIDLPAELTRYCSFFFRTMVAAQSLKRLGGEFNMLVCSIYGIDYAHYVVHNLRAVYPNVFDRIDAIEHVPTQFTLDPSGYDVLLSDSRTGLLKQSLLHSSISVVWLPAINRPVRIDELDAWINQRRTNRLSAISKDRIHHTSCRTKKEIQARMYEYLHGDLSLTQEEFIASLDAREQIIPSARDNRISLNALNGMSGEKDMIEVLINSKPLLWNDEKLQFFVFYNYTGSDRRTLRAITLFLQRFVRQTPANLISLVKKNSSDIISFIMADEANQ